MAEFWVPFPPSANHLHSGGRGRRFMTANYRQWISDATECVADAKPQPLPYWPDRPYKLFITAARPDRRRRDLDNIIKPINDLLKRTGLVADDHLCDSLHARWVTTGDGVAVRIEPAGVE